MSEVELTGREFPCTGCGFEVFTASLRSGEYLTCPECGARQKVPGDSGGRVVKRTRSLAPPPADQSSGSASGTKVCPFCAEEVKAAAIKCKHCGEALGPGIAPSFAPAPRAPGPAAPRSLITKKCPNCGSSEVGEDLKCRACESQLAWSGDGTLKIAGLTHDCPKCGSTGPAGALNCAKCGAMLQKDCIVCGEFHAVDATHCASTGRSLAQAHKELTENLKVSGSDPRFWVALDGVEVRTCSPGGCLGFSPIESKFTVHSPTLTIAVHPQSIILNDPAQMFSGGFAAVNFNPGDHPKFVRMKDLIETRRRYHLAQARGRLPEHGP